MWGRSSVFKKGSSTESWDLHSFSLQGQKNDILSDLPFTAVSVCYQTHAQRIFHLASDTSLSSHLTFSLSSVHVHFVSALLQRYTLDVTAHACIVSAHTVAKRGHSTQARVPTRTHTHEQMACECVFAYCVCIYFCEIMRGLPWWHTVLSPPQQRPDVETQYDT